MDYDEAYSSDQDDMDENDRPITMDAAPIAKDGLSNFIKRGRTINADIHPYLRTGLCWISESTKRQKLDVLKEEGTVYSLPGIRSTPLRPLRTRLTTELAEVFEDLQFTYNEEAHLDVSYAVAKASRQYRSLLNAFVSEASQTAENEGLVEADEEYVQILLDAISIWQCAEAIYIPMSIDGLRCDALMEWVNKLDPRPTQEEGEDIMTIRRPCLHPEFWDYVSKGIVRGLFDMVSTCLVNSGLSGEGAKASNELCLLLQTCPRVSKYETKPEDFKLRYRQWRGKLLIASRQIDIKDQELASSFRQVYELLKGDRDALMRQCDTWQECLAAMALLYDPTGCRAPKDVRALFELVTESEDSVLAVDITLASDVACAALCMGNIPKAIAQARRVDLGLAAHVSDLLEKIEILEEIKSGDLELTLRDVLTLDLGDHCIGDPETWRAAISYWRTVGDAGLDRVQQMLPRIPITSQTRVDEILGLCNDLEMLDEAAEVETAWARKLEGAGKYLDAINAYDRACNPQQIDRLNWILFKQTVLRGIPISDTDLDTALEGPQYTNSRTISSLLSPYAVLCQFYALKASDPPKAAIHLAALLKHSDMPKELMAILMAEMLPFLRPDACQFGLRDIFDSLAAIEEFYDSADFDQGVGLLSQAMQCKPDNDADWRNEVVRNMNAQDVLALVRTRLAHSVGELFCLA